METSPLKLSILRAQAALELNKTNLAHLEITKGLALEPENYYLHYLRSRCLQKEKKIDSAIASLLHTISLSANFVQAHLLLAYIYYYTKKNSKGIFHIDFCMEREPTNPHVLVIAALLYKDTDPSESKVLLNTAKIIAPNNTAVQSASETLALYSFNFDTYEELINEAMQKNPTSPSNQLNMGLVELAKGNYDQAASLLQQGYIYNPKPEIMDAWIDAKLGKFLPFKWFISICWREVTYPLRLQLSIYIVFIYVTMSIVHSDPFAFGIIIPIIQVPIALIATFIYVIRYPVQYIYRRLYHSETAIICPKDILKLSAIFTTILFWFFIINGYYPYIFLSILFIFLYLFSGALSLKSLHNKFLKTIAYTLLFIACSSFIATISLFLLDIDTARIDTSHKIFKIFLIENPRLITIPALSFWFILLMLSDLEESIEKWRIPKK